MLNKQKKMKFKKERQSCSPKWCQGVDGLEELGRKVDTSCWWGKTKTKKLLLFDIQIFQSNKIQNLSSGMTPPPQFQLCPLHKRTPSATEAEQWWIGIAVQTHFWKLGNDFTWQYDWSLQGCKCFLVLANLLYILKQKTNKQKFRLNH